MTEAGQLHYKNPSERIHSTHNRDMLQLLATEIDFQAIPIVACLVGQHLHSLKLRRNLIFLFEMLTPNCFLHKQSDFVHPVFLCPIPATPCSQRNSMCQAMLEKEQI